LLEKANGDVAVAVDIFYSSSEGNNVIEVDKNIMLQNAQGETADNCSETDMASGYSQATPKMSNLHVGTSLAHGDSANTSLLIEKYLPIEHG
jgi:DNA ligase 1